MDSKFNNFIGGKEIGLSGKHFKIESEFYDYSIEAADSGMMDISVALSKAGKADSLKRLSFDERMQILREAEKKLSFSEDEIKYNVMMTGMPIKYVREYIESIPKILSDISLLVEKKYEHINHKKTKRFFDGINKFEHRVPIRGPIYAVAPSNDARVSALISAISISLGIPAIIKTSKSDLPISLKIAKTLISCGLPNEALAILTFDTAKKDAQKKNFKLVEGSSIIWVFGDDETVDNTLRFDKKRYFDLESFYSQIKINPESDFNNFLDAIKKDQKPFLDNITSISKDYFSQKTVLRHASGRCSGVLNSDFNLKRASEIIVDSSLNYPIGCNSMKSLHVVQSAYDEIISDLKERFAERKVGDPLNKDTDVGYISKQTLDYVDKRARELSFLKLLHIDSDYKRMSDVQSTPLLCSTKDVHSEFLSKEYSAYERTTEIDAIIHEGNDYIMQLTRPRVLHKKDF